ncbi:hypothetical protein BBOR36S_01167 [Brevibacillus borstelensis]
MKKRIAGFGLAAILALSAALVGCSSQSGAPGSTVREQGNGTARWTERRKSADDCQRQRHRHF